MRRKEILKRIYKGNPSEKYHWLVGYLKGKLVIIGPYDTINSATNARENYINSVIIHLNIKDITFAGQEIKHRIKHINDITDNK